MQKRLKYIILFIGYSIVMLSALMGCKNNNSVEPPTTQTEVVTTETTEALTTEDNVVIAWEASEKKIYKFKKSDTDLINGGGVTIASITHTPDTQKYQATFLGRCVALFGEPYDVSDNYEALYNYFIIAEDENGNTANLEIYFGSGGPSIGYGESEFEEKAAIALARKLLMTEPVDCEISSTYDDASVRVIMGVKNGEPFYESFFLEE